MKENIGIFVCNCGGEIAKTIDMARVCKFAEKLPNVPLVKEHPALCLREAEDFVSKLTKDFGLDRLVIAACTPQLHLQTFRKYAENAGLNPYLVEVVNIREQCALPHLKDSGATEKALRLLRGAVEKIRLQEEVEAKDFEVVPSAVVIGGGVAGLQACSDIAQHGFDVYLVERALFVGGNATKIGRAFPTDDCAFCIPSIHPLPGNRKCFYRCGVGLHPKIHLLTNSTLKDVKVSSANFNVKIVTNPRFVSQEKCIGCGVCSQACPVEIPGEPSRGIGSRKAIFLPSHIALPQTYAVDMEHCNKCGRCVAVCPTKAIDLEEKETELDLDAGAIIVATGCEEFDPSRKKEYGYGLYEDVITQLELARLLDPAGPNKGVLRRPSDGKKPKTLVMIQCVGSRDEKANRYCSKVCCMIALKHAHFIKLEQDPEAEIYVCFMDMRTGGKGYEDYYTGLMEMGAKLVRGRPSKIQRDHESGKLIVEVEDMALGRLLEIDADLVVLSTGLVPSKESAKIAELLGLDIGPDGFIMEYNPKLNAVETKIEGVYVCGAAQGPKDIPESITQASAAAMKAVTRISKAKIRKDLATAAVDREVCDGCEICVEVCPYSAIEMTETMGPTKLAKIDEYNCRGCGNCTSYCPTGAIQLRLLSDKQIFAQISGVLSNEGVAPSSHASSKVIAFCCDECSYAAADMAGAESLQYPSNILPITVPCLGRISILHILKALKEGAGGVLLIGCLPKGCHYLVGEENARFQADLTKDLLSEIGLDKFVEIRSACAATPNKFIDAMMIASKELKTPTFTKT